MNLFSYRSGRLYCEDVALDDLGERVGTPVYVYSKETLRQHYTRFAAAFAPLSPQICFAIKSCWNIHIVRMLASLGAGIDIVSGGELFRALHAGVDAKKIVAAGVGKTEAELSYILKSNVGWLNVESEQEFEAAARIAKKIGVTQNVALRINPDIRDPRTPEKTTTGTRGVKFGVDLERAQAFFKTYARDTNLRLVGLHVHLGSPIYETGPYLLAVDKLLALMDKLRGDGLHIESLDLGGGFASDYDSSCQSWTDYANPIAQKLAPFVRDGGRVILEPGRTLCANSAVLLATAQYTKLAGERKLVIVDAGMNDLARVAMYNAYHFMWPTTVPPELTPKSYAAQPEIPGLDEWDVAGPICETSDYFARGRRLPAMQHGERLAIFGAGAYGIVQACNYNSRPLPAEVLVDGSKATLIRKRQSYEDLIAAELDAHEV